MRSHNKRSFNEISEMLANFKKIFNFKNFLICILLEGLLVVIYILDGKSCPKCLELFHDFNWKNVRN